MGKTSGQPTVQENRKIGEQFAPFSLCFSPRVRQWLEEMRFIIEGDEQYAGDRQNSEGEFRDRVVQDTKFCLDREDTSRT